MLARACFRASQSGNSPVVPNSSILGDRLINEAASLCIEAAQKIASIIVATSEAEYCVGILPWWYRIYGLHIAATHLLAAMFLPTLFTESVSQSWDSVISTLRRHDHLSEYVGQCIRSFVTMSTRIAETKDSSQASNADELLDGETAGLSFEDIFQDMGFDLDSFWCNGEDVMGLPC